MGKASIINSSFRPAWWLPSRHLQTIWPTLFRAHPEPEVNWQTLELADGDVMRLGWRKQVPGRPLVMLIHGLEGGTDSHYVPTVLHALEAKGFNTVFLSLRGAGGVPNRLAKSYHSGATDDLRLLLTAMQSQPDAVIGVSLGGNLLLKYLGEERNKAPFKQAVAVSIPFDLSICADVLENDFARRYGKYLLLKLKRSYYNKFSRIDNPLDVDIDAVQTLRQFDDQITAPLNGFRDAEDYYQQSACKPVLKQIAIPTLIIHSRDDPFMRPEIVPDADEVSDSVSLEITDHGGHVGFVQGRLPFVADHWLGKRIADHLASAFGDST